MKRTLRIGTALFGMLCLLAALIQGCSILGGSEAVDPTVSGLSAAVAQTATAAQLGSGKVDDLATAQAKATQKSLEIQATQTARASSRSESDLAAATVAAPIVAELPQYGLDTSGGRVGWVQGPLTLDISGYQEFDYANDKMEVTAADFALAADITWDTQYGSSGCGFMFRSNGDQDKSSQYLVLATRFGNGHVIFSAVAEGEIANIHDFYPKTEDRSFDWQNGSTNRLAVIARGNLIEIYTNGVKIGEVDTTQPPSQLSAPPKPLPPLDQSNAEAMAAYQDQLQEYQDILKQSDTTYQTALSNYSKRQAVFDEGFLAMIAASESGRTICTFDDAWLWLIEP